MRTKSEFIIKNVFILILFSIILIIEPIRVLSENQSSMHAIPSLGRIVYNPSRLHTDGRWIKDEHNNIIRLRGCAWIELGYIDNLLQDPEERANQMKEIGVNCIRLDTSSSRWMKSRAGTSYQDYVSNHKKIIDILNEKGIYVIIILITTRDTWGEWTPEMRWNDIEFDTDRWIPFLVDIAEFYKDYSNVILDIWGEGVWYYGGHSYSEAEEIWNTRVNEAISQIRQVNPNIVLVVPELKISRINYFYDNPLPYSNIIYGIQRWYHHDLENEQEYAYHYANGDLLTARQKQEEMYDQALFIMKTIDKPVILKSFGAYPSDPHATVQITDLYELFNERESNWIQHVWYPHVNIRYGLVDSNWNLNQFGELWSLHLS